jgi:RNA polymerase sigma-70 factor (ECF subfamily)
VSIGEAWTVGKLEGGESAAPAEQALLAAAREGDPIALEHLVARHQRSLFLLCRSIVRDPDDAEDAVQETFLRALRALPGFRGDAAFRTWLTRIAINVCLKWKTRQPATATWDEALSAADTDSPERIALRHLRLREALGALSARHRALLLLKEVEGWSMAEIAAAMGWNEKRVDNELYRARRALLAWRQREGREGEEV